MEKPKIRFGKFNNKWKKNKLDKVVDFFDNQRIPIDSGERKAGPYPYYGASGIIDYVDGYIFNGEYVLLAEDGANIIFRSSPIAYLTKGKFWLNNHAHIMKMKTGSNEFLIQLLEKQNYEKYNTGTAQPKLNGEVVKKITLHFPSDEEQSSIGSLFRTLDDLQVSYKDNLANYQSLKAVMLSKMFPKAGQTVPEIRLDGFEGEWKKSKLKDVTNRVQGNDGRMDLPTLTISASGGWMNQIDRFSANIAGKEQKNYTLLKKGELSYNHGNSKLAKYGVVFELKEYEEALVPKVYHSFRVNQLADAKFIEIMFSTKIPDRELGKLVSSGARMDGLLNISFDDFMNIAIIIPTFAEQQAIGAYFSNLDNLINSYQEKISQLETLKKKLLQDMFI